RRPPRQDAPCARCFALENLRLRERRPPQQRSPDADTSELRCAADGGARNHLPLSTWLPVRPLELPFYNPRAMAAPATTAARQSALLATMFTAIRSHCPCSM